MPFENEDYNRETEFVVCAAERHKTSGFIICGARHWDDIMHGVMREMKRTDYQEFEDGFITNRRRFIHRSEAFNLAGKNEQIRFEKDMPMTGMLFSEHLY